MALNGYGSSTFLMDAYVFFWKQCPARCQRTSRSAPAAPAIRAAPASTVALAWDSTSSRSGPSVGLNGARPNRFSVLMGAEEAEEAEGAEEEPPEAALAERRETRGLEQMKCEDKLMHAVS